MRSVKLMIASFLMLGMSGLAMAKEKAASAGLSSTVMKEIMLAPPDLNWMEGPESLPVGAEMAVLEGDPKVANALFTIRFKFPANYKVMPHSHPADEHITVLSGSIELGMGEKFNAKNLKMIPVGGFAVMPRGHNHYAMTKEETIIQLHGVGPWSINYVKPSDDPRRLAKK